MNVYRYDHKDGGGPFMTADGICRTDDTIQMDDGYLSCCLSLELLIEYFNKHKVNLHDCYISTYDIPEYELKKSYSHYYFPKKYKNNRRN